MPSEPATPIRWLLLAVLLLVGLGACEADPEVASAPPVRPLPYYDSRDFTPRWLEGPPPAGFHRVPTFSLTDQHGQALTEADLDGRVSVVAFFFTACGGICPELREALAEVDAALAPEAPVLLLAHSVTPRTDTVARLQAYAARHELSSPRWHLLTGSRALIYRLGREVYFSEEDLGEEKGPDDFLHTENLVLVDQYRHLRGIYNGLRTADRARLLAHIEVLLAARPSG